MVLANSPPLYHPVPQYVSTVPQLRSPAPPVPLPQEQQQGQQYGYSQQHHGGPYMNTAFGGFATEPTAQMGFRVGKRAVVAGQEYMEKNFNNYVDVSAFKRCFNVTNSYVVNKLYTVLFPWRHCSWSRQQQGMSVRGQNDLFLPPCEDINSPDLYIPVMAVITYILLCTLFAGTRGAFHPELLGVTASNASAAIFLELVILKLGTYFLNISNDSQLLDLVAYSGYKFVGVGATVAIDGIYNSKNGKSSWIGSLFFAYAYLAVAFFLLRSLRFVLVPVGPQHDAHSQRARRVFLFVHSYGVQLALMWWLTRLS